MYLHSYYFNRYEFYPFKKNKSEDGKIHTYMIKNKDFKGVILDLIDMLLETQPEDVPSECCGVKLTNEDICEFVYFLFYPHFKLAKDSILDNYVKPDECITLFLKGLKSESRNYFSNDKENEFAEYLHFLESYDKREDYFKGSGIEKPCVLMDKWRYFLSEQCVEDCKKENRSKLEESKAYFPNEIYYTYKNNFDKF